MESEASTFVRRETNEDELEEENPSTQIDKEEDSEASATTIDDKRTTILSRGRGRFSTIAATEAIGPSATTESAITQKRPAFARFTPRPFARPTLKPIVRDRSENVISPRVPPRVPFGRPRPSASNSVPGIQPRRLPFPSRISTTTTTTTTTEQPSTLDSDEDDLENKRDDIYLSESAIEEKEHNDENHDDESLNLKEIDRITTTETSGIGETVSSDSGTRKFKVIRRRPTTTTVAAETTFTPPVTDVTMSTVPRIRKIIRKKIKPSEYEVEATTKLRSTEIINDVPELTSNYGEKTKSTTATPTTTQSISEAEEIPIEPKFEFTKQQPKLKEENTGQDNAKTSETEAENESENKNDEAILETENLKPQINESFAIKSNANTEEQVSDSETNQKSFESSQAGDLTEKINGNFSSPDNDNLQKDSDKNDDVTTTTEKESQNISNINDKAIMSQNVTITNDENNSNSTIGGTSDIPAMEVKLESETFNSTSKADTASDEKTVVAVESNDKAIDLSETQPSVAPLSSQVNDTTQITPETTIKTTTQATSPSPRSRLPYRPPKRLFTSTTESSLPSSSKTFSRKFNPGVYTSPASVGREPFKPAVTRRPLFSRTYTRKPFTTARTTKQVEEEDEYSDEELLDEEGLDEEPENPFVFVPPSQLYTRKPDSEEEYEDEGNDEFEEGSEEEIYDEEQPTTTTTTTTVRTTLGRFTTSSRRPLFKPRLINSNTFRTSTTTTELPHLETSTTQLPKIPIDNEQNKTVSYNRFASNKPINDTKKRVQNVPIGYNIPVSKPNIPSKNNSKPVINPIKEEKKITTARAIEITTTENNEYLSNSEQVTTQPESQVTNKIEIETTTEQIDIENNTSDYLENTEETVTLAPREVLSNVFNEPVTFSKTESPATSLSPVTVLAPVTTLTPETTLAPVTTVAPLTTRAPITTAAPVTTIAPTTERHTTTEPVPETTIIPTTPPPIVKTQFNKLFSVSRVVEVSSKLDKHHLNKNNETTFIEEGPIVIEKKPTVDKIGEVSRFTLIKIVEDEIPIYLTKLGHVYPVDNPPNNPIRIDEARNARSLIDDNYPKENLLTSESMNKAYRHNHKAVTQRKETMLKREVEHVRDDNFLSYINEDKKSEKTEGHQTYPQWQFVPAAYENELNKQAKNFEVVTPRIVRNDASTLSLEGLFKTSPPVAKNTKEQPFFVYSIAAANEKNQGKPAKSEALKMDIITSLDNKSKESEIKVNTDKPTTMQPTIKSTTLEIIESPPTTMTPNTTVKDMITSPIVSLLMTTRMIPSEDTTTTFKPTTTESKPIESTTTKISPRNGKKSNFPYVRRPIIRSNITRTVVTPKTPIKLNATTKFNAVHKTNKTLSFSPSKSRFSGGRAQNVPIDVRKKTTVAKFTPKIYTTETPKTTTEKKTFTKPKRPNFRPSFVPRRSTGTPSVTNGDI
ncbi:mucin-2-like [Battus philenor]|uniref:mucin-2-like n=1 Tax=Battus philenor TaxID=42288 RepID=UPI0035D1089A